MPETHLTPTYPDWNEFKNTIPVLMSLVKGGTPDWEEGKQALWIAVGFGLTMLPKKADGVGSGKKMTKAQALDCLEKCSEVASADGFSAGEIPWDALIGYLLPILLDWLRK